VVLEPSYVNGIRRCARGLLRGCQFAVCICALSLLIGPQPARASADFQRGFVLTGRYSDSYLSSDTATNLGRMATAGSSHAAIFTQWFMSSPTSSHLAPDADRTPTDESLLGAIALAREKGLQVTIKPQIGIYDGSWIGDAHPDDLDAFWSDYRTMLLHYADLAQQSGATMLVIGTEMRTLSSDEGRWRALIAAIREHFHGALTYAANYDEFESVPFWDALDYIGIDAYFSLAAPGDPSPSTDALTSAWSDRGYLRRIASVSEATGKRVLFTEVGYRAAHTTAVQPNDWAVQDQTDEAAQSRAYDALYRALTSQSWMAGLYWWEVSADQWWVQDYSPIAKPAEQVMASWNSRLASDQSPQPAGPSVPPVPSVDPPPIAPVLPTDGTYADPPRPSASKPPTRAQRAVVHLTLRGRVARGIVRPYSKQCGGRVVLQVRRRVHGRWRYLRPPAAVTPASSGRFVRKVGRGRLRVRAAFRSNCSRAKSAWVSSRG
jgi:hypothetical protein